MVLSPSKRFSNRTGALADRLARIKSPYGQPADDLSSYFAGRSRDMLSTTVEHLEKEAGGDRSRIVAYFKTLDDLGVGVFIPGRKGHPSRFQWNYSSQCIGKIAAGENLELEPVSSDADDGSREPEIRNRMSGMVEHNFQVRPQVRVSFTLPVDLNEKEARRLAEFIRTLPFDTEFDER